MITNALGFDFESHLIGPDVCPCGEIHGQFPPAVCMSWCLPNGDSDVVTPAEGIAILKEALAAGMHLVGAETAFDVLLSCVNNQEPDGFDGLLAKFVEAYEVGRIHDVCLRQKLLDLAGGSYRWITHSDGRRLRIGYDLATTAKRVTGRVLEKPSKETKDTHPRLRYALLDGTPIADWPAADIRLGMFCSSTEYAREDSVAAIETFLEQERWQESTQGQKILDIWQGRECAAFQGALDPLGDERAQTCHALWLKAMSGEGLVIDPIALAAFEKRVRKEYIALCAEVRTYRAALDGDPKSAPLLRREYWRDLKRLRELQHPYRDNKLWKALKAELDHDLPEALEIWAELLRAGLVRWVYKKGMNAARARMFAVCLLKHKPIPHTDKFDPERDAFNEKIAIDSDSCRLSEDVGLIAYAELTHAGKMLTGDIPTLKKGVDRPIHTHYEVLLETGRISSAGPNVTNRARGEGKEVKQRDGTMRAGHAGDRECFACRPGNALIDCDYPQLELYALAQCCRWVLGYSTLGDVLVAGKDPHTAFAALIAGGITYEEAKLRAKAKSLPERDAAKGCNFGRPGGLGAETMVSYAAKSYGVVRSQDQWEELFKLWDQQWPEMPEYFEYINGLESEDGKFAIVTPATGLLRAGATYCAACNHNYQALGAAVAKRAGWYVFKACYVPGVDADLFGCMPVNFIHDQLLVEAPKERAAAAAARVEYWMGLAASELMPDYGPTMAANTEAILCARYSKMAEKVVGADGSLEVWEDKRLLLDCGFDEEEEPDEESEAA